MEPPTSREKILRSSIIRQVNYWKLALVRGVTGKCLPRMLYGCGACQQWGPWQEHLVANALRQYGLNESASPRVEMLQMKYRVTRSVEVIYQEVSKRIRLQPLYRSTAYTHNTNKPMHQLTTPHKHGEVPFGKHFHTGPQHSFPWNWPDHNVLPFSLLFN